MGLNSGVDARRWGPAALRGAGGERGGGCGVHSCSTQFFLLFLLLLLLLLLLLQHGEASQYANVR